MLIKKKNLMRLLISSFDATIRVKRAFHPAPASRGFASHVFLVIYMYVCMFIYFREGVRILPSNGEKQSMNDVRLSGVVCSKICIHRESLRVG